MSKVSQIGNGKAGRALSLPVSLRCCLLLPFFLLLLLPFFLLLSPMAPSTRLGTQDTASSMVFTPLTCWAGQGAPGAPRKEKPSAAAPRSLECRAETKVLGACRAAEPLGSSPAEVENMDWSQVPGQPWKEEVWACSGMRIGPQNVRALKTLKTSQSYLSFCNWGH